MEFLSSDEFVVGSFDSFEVVLMVMGFMGIGGILCISESAEEFGEGFEVTACEFMTD